MADVLVFSFLALIAGFCGGYFLGRSELKLPQRPHKHDWRVTIFSNGVLRTCRGCEASMFTDANDCKRQPQEART